MTAPAIDIGELANAVWTSVVAGVIVTGTFRGAFYGLARFNEEGASAYSARALASLVLAVACLPAFVAAIVLGLLAMVQK